MSRRKSARVEEISGWHVISLDLWWSPGMAYGTDVNAGLDRVVETIERAMQRNPEFVRIHDASDLSNEERTDLYMRVAPTTGGFWNYRVRNVFGTNTSPGFSLGRGVPLLLTSFEEYGIPLAAPHIEWDRSSPDPRHVGNVTHTILDVLLLLSPAEQERVLGERLTDASPR